MVADVTSQIGQLCDRRRLTCSVERIHDAGAVQCSPALVDALRAAVKESEQVSMHSITHRKAAPAPLFGRWHPVYMCKPCPGYLMFIKFWKSKPLKIIDTRLRTPTWLESGVQQKQSNPKGC